MQSPFFFGRTVHSEGFTNRVKEIKRLKNNFKHQVNTICINEFQNLSVFKDPLLFQKRLRSEWQHHYHVNYCLYGSQQHMMMELFERQSMPFYKFGDVMYLSKIHRKDWISFIIAKFQSTGKKIDEHLADMIAGFVQDHSYYVQQLSHLVWINTHQTASSARGSLGVISSVGW